MAKRKPLPDWANKIGTRVTTHSNAILALVEKVSENPKDAKQMLRLYAEAAIVVQLIDQLMNPEEENGKKQQGH